jgi:copper chaperone
MKIRKFFQSFCLMFFVFLLVNVINPADSFAQSTGKTEKKTVVKSGVKTVELEVEGMTCQKGCADGIDKKLRKTAGIKQSNTLQKTGISKVTYDASVINVKQIIKIIEDRGYKAKVAST